MKRVIYTKPGTIGVGGTVNTFVSATLTEADNYWVDQFVTFTTGNAVGQSARIVGFTTAANTVTFEPPVTAAPASGDSMVIWGFAGISTASIGRTLDLNVSGQVGLDYDNTSGTIQDADVDVIGVNTVSMDADVIGASQIATDAIGAPEIASAGAVKIFTADTSLITTGIGVVIEDIMDTLQAQDDWVAKEASLYDGSIVDADMVAIVDTTWDRLLTGASHNIATSAGRRLREVATAFVITSGVSLGGTSTTINLAADAPDGGMNEIFAGDRVIIVAGTGTGEHGIITTYDAGTNVATMSQAWVVTPLTGDSEYELSPADVDVETWQHQVVTATGALPDVNVESVDANPAADISDSVWAKDTTGLLDAGKYGLEATTGGAASISKADMGEIADSSAQRVWGHVADTAYAGGTFGDSAKGWGQTGGSTSGTRTIGIFAEAPAGDSIAGVTISIEANGVPEGDPVATGAGVPAVPASFLLDDGTYQIIAKKNGYAWSSTTLVVTGNDSVSIIGSVNTLAPLADATKVPIFGDVTTITGITGTDVYGWIVKAWTTRSPGANAVDSADGDIRIVAPFVMSATTDSTGRFQINVIPSSDMVDTSQAYYVVECKRGDDLVFLIEGLYIIDTVNVGDSLAFR